jgi:Calcineurin-like phosphoesterase
MARSERILVLGDVHNAWTTAEVILSNLRSRYDKVILLGDYFDDFGDTPRQAAETAYWLAYSLRQPERIHLLGNHDLPYLYPENSWLFCPGFTVEKHIEIEHHLLDAPCDGFQLAHCAHGWLFSHAGFAGRFAEGETVEVLAALANKLLAHLGDGHHEPWLVAGLARGGSEPVGGITWLDWNIEFHPLPGIHQIVGHTPSDFARGRHLDPHGGDVKIEVRKATVIRDVPGAQRRRWRSLNWCLDTGLRQVALIDSKSVRILNPALDQVPTAK